VRGFQSHTSTLPTLQNRLDDAAFGGVPDRKQAIAEVGHIGAAEAPGRACTTTRTRTCSAWCAAPSGSACTARQPPGTCTPCRCTESRRTTAPWTSPRPTPAATRCTSRPASTSSWPTFGCEPVTVHVPSRSGPCASPVPSNVGACTILPLRLNCNQCRQALQLILTASAPPDEAADLVFACIQANSTLKPRDPVWQQG